MAPTVFHSGPYRYFFFSREESRMHVHVSSSDGEAKFWLEPTIALANYKGLNSKQLNAIEREVRKKQSEIEAAWKKHLCR